jgi:hypothetical protein
MVLPGIGRIHGTFSPIVQIGGCLGKEQKSQCLHAVIPFVGLDPGTPDFVVPLVVPSLPSKKGRVLVCLPWYLPGHGNS